MDRVDKLLWIWRSEVESERMRKKEERWKDRGIGKG